MMPHDPTTQAYPRYPCCKCCDPVYADERSLCLLIGTVNEHRVPCLDCGQQWAPGFPLGSPTSE